MRSPATVSVVFRLALVGGLAAFGFGLNAHAVGVPEHIAVIKPASVEYYATAESLRNGMPIVPPRIQSSLEHPLHVMKRLVSQAEYQQCVQDKGCRPLHKTQVNDTSPDLPVVGVSWDDATAYAKWLSEKTGQTYRLPTYGEWVHVAGEAFKEDQRLDIYDPNNPAQRWLAEYAMEAQRKSASNPFPQPFGTFGTTAAGVQDIGGNVWEWTDTCHVRQYVDDTGAAMLPPTENCGIRVVAGSHHSLITDFMRDPKAGACSVGIPPANLGIRLVLEL